MATSPELGFERWLVTRFSAVQRPRPVPRRTLLDRFGDHPGWIGELQQLQQLPPTRRRKSRYFAPAHANPSVACAAYPDFGLWVMCTQRVYVAVRCGRVRRETLGAHAHLDQLSLNLEIDGRPVLRDPGTFVYSADPDARHRYRCAEAHGIPLASRGRRAARSVGLFELDGDLDGECLWFGEGEFAGLHRLCGVPIYRRVLIGAQGVEVEDYSPEVDLVEDGRLDLAYSPGYGRRFRAGGTT